MIKEWSCPSCNSILRNEDWEFLVTLPECKSCNSIFEVDVDKEGKIIEVKKI